MDGVTHAIDALIDVLKGTPEYTAYQALEERLRQEPDLKRRIDEYRTKAYNMQRSGYDIFDETDYCLDEYRDLQENALALAYLDAESSVCRRLRQVIDRIVDEVGVEVP